MKIGVVIGAGVFAATVATCSVIVTRDGERTVPEGRGTVTLDAGEFEAFPLPDYAARHVTDDYKSYFVEVEPGIKVHVLEVGSGYPVFLQHGNPTSGLLYRKVVEELPTGRFRVIMPTLVGLGYSSKVPASEHTLANHIRWIGGVLEQLQLEEVVYVGQDWGGPVGMGALARSPGLLKGAVLMNTFFSPPREEVDLSDGHRLARRPVVGELIVEVSGMVFERLPQNQGDPDSLPAEVIELYRRPLEESANAKAPLAMMRMVSNGPDHPTTPAMSAVEEYVQELDIPAEIVWGMNDPIFGARLSLMKNHFPAARVTETAGGHFLQEEVPVEIAAAVVRVAENAQSSQARQIMDRVEMKEEKR